MDQRNGLRVTWLVLLGVLATPREAFAHPGQPPLPHDLAAAWSWEPQIVLLLLGTLALYVAGVLRVWSRAGRGRGVAGEAAAAFFGGWLALFLALVSPLDALGDALFSAHMAQHLLLTLVAAPLLILARPVAALVWGLPAGWSVALARGWVSRPAFHRPVRWLARPGVAWILHAAAITTWHVPGLYEWALASDFAHGVEHAAFFGTALLFWSALITGRGRALSYGTAILYIFTMALVSTLLGALITFARAPWYASYQATTAAWGLSPLADQQLAGAIMWVPAGIVYVGTALALLAAWLRAVEARVAAREAADAARAEVPQAARLAGRGRAAS